jgi:hypothetical protein
VKKSITINSLAKSALVFSLILGGCAAIFVGVAGGYRSPLAPAADTDVAKGAAADVHTASLLKAPLNSEPQSRY